ncbi:MAG: FkbM family methyltransferase [Pyrinomonadaceae bacterium]
MRFNEKIVFAIRHNRYLGRAEWIWRFLRPLYDSLNAVTGRKGLERVINSTDKLLIAPQWRMIGEVYEPEVWRSLMSQVRVGDVVADVGSYLGLYTLALAKRVGETGRVFAFEPNRGNYRALKEHVILNDVAGNVSIVQAAVGERNGYADLKCNLDSSYIDGAIKILPEEQDSSVRCLTLDGFFEGAKLDLLKIDVEGYEEKVLEGAKCLLSDKDRSPRAIFIEVHPYAWPTVGTTSESLLDFLAQCGYDVRDLDRTRVLSIEHYGEVVAYKATDGFAENGKY